MILIFNTGGLVVGVLAIVVGMAVLIATGHSGAGFGAMGLVCLLFGRRKSNPRGRGAAAGEPAPSIFFIPLSFWAIPILGLAAVSTFSDPDGSDFSSRSSSRRNDPRRHAFDTDNKSLSDSKLSGDAALSKGIYTVLVAASVDDAKASEFHVFTEKREDRVLVLIKAPSLGKFANSARKELLQAIGQLVNGQDALKDHKVYIGIKGRFAYGAIQLPDGQQFTGRLVDKDRLLPFYTSTAKKTPKKSSDPSPDKKPDTKDTKKPEAATPPAPK